MNNMGHIPVEQWAPPWTQLKVFGNKDNFGMECTVPENCFDRSLQKSRYDNALFRSNETNPKPSQCKTLSPCSDKSGFEAEVICMSPNSDKISSKDENYSSAVENISFDEVKSGGSANHCPQEFPLDLLGNILPDMNIKEEPIAVLDVGQPSSEISTTEWPNNTTPAHFDALKVVSEHLVERIKLEDVCQNGPGYPFCFGQSPTATSFKHPFGIASQYQVNGFPPYASETNNPTIIRAGNGNHRDTSNNSFNISMNNNLMCTTMFLMNESLQQNGPHQAHNPVRKHHDIFNIACEKGCNCETANSIFRAGNSLMFSPDKHPATSKHFMSPCGPLQLTAQECGELLLKKVSTAGSIIGPETLNMSVDNQSPVDGSNVQRKSRPPGSNVTVVHQGTLTENGAKISPLQGQKYRVAKERPFSCTECGKSFLLKHHLVTHARVHTGERPHVCPECGKSFAHKHCLSTHLLLHSSDRPYKCMECKKSFTLKHHLVTHARVHSRDRPFVCQECGRTFPQKRHLVTHGKFHSGERPFVCDECGESFAQKDHLVMHSRFHGAQRAFVCPDCGSTFARKFELVNHGRLHGRLPHSCEICGKEFLQKRTLLAHARLHIEGERPFVCQHCGEHFARKSELTEHSSIHTEDTKFVCSHFQDVPLFTQKKVFINSY
ncbi:zinc finger protein 211-like isoform X1 [Bacillus rossius redtenbacheri]|uniref:zinc finger protein 211-like isoform X1 n=1 Tax=Bacillus rossius redtenbacheri TaxID=93214 RepID=UPI002FDD2C48